MKDESSSEKVIKPKRRHWWWLWGWAAVVVVLGVAWVRWYDAQPAEYRVVRQYTLAGSYPNYWCRESGALLQEGERTFVYRDLEGKEEWRVEAPAADVSGRPPGDVTDYLQKDPEADVSPDGHICAIAISKGRAWAVHTWRDGIHEGVTVVPDEVKSPDEVCSVSSNDDGSIFFTVIPEIVPASEALGNAVTYLILGGHVVASGKDLRFGTVTPDSHTLIQGIDGICSYGQVRVRGKKLSVVWGARTVYDGRYGGMGRACIQYGRPDLPFVMPECWSVASTYDKFGVKANWKTLPVAGTLLMKKVADRVTVYHHDTMAGWSIPLPKDTTAVVATDDDQHILVGHGLYIQPPDPWEKLHTWPVIGRLVPRSSRSPQITLSLYNRLGVCEASLPYKQVMRANCRIARNAAGA